jgi:hypothetical protein
MFWSSTPVAHKSSISPSDTRDHIKLGAHKGRPRVVTFVGIESFVSSLLTLIFHLKSLAPLALRYMP